MATDEVVNGPLPLERHRVGTSDLVISSLGIGTAALATPYGPPGSRRPAPDRQLARHTITRALEAGITFIDTAPAYGDAEAIVGETIAGVDCEIATKLPVPAGGWPGLAARKVRDHIRRSVERSLERLRRTQIDLLQIHNADAELVERLEVTAGLEELRDEGLVRACGATVYGESNALAVIACPTFDAVQISYSALDRRPEHVLIGAAARAETAIIARSLLLHGVLTSAGCKLSEPFAALSRAADAFRAAADVSWEELPGAAVAFVFTRPGIACTLLGPRDPAELDSLLFGAVRWADAVRNLEGDWNRELSEELLDPSNWPKRR